MTWRAGAEGTSILVSDTPLADPHPTPRPVLDAADIGGSVEYARLGRPLIFGNTVVAEALRAADVEQPLPGDRTLVTVRFDGAPVSAGPPLLSSVAGQHDVEFLSPVVDLLGHQTGGPYTFAARVSGVRPVVFTVDRASGELATVVTGAADSVGLLGDLALPMVTVLGAFDSRQVFAPLRGGNEGARLLIRYFSDGELAEVSDASPSTTDLAALGDPTADAVATLVGGAPDLSRPDGGRRARVRVCEHRPRAPRRSGRGSAMRRARIPRLHDGQSGRTPCSSRADETVRSFWARFVCRCRDKWTSGCNTLPPRGVALREARDTVTENPDLPADTFDFPKGAASVFDEDAAARGRRNREWFRSFASVGLLRARRPDAPDRRLRRSE